MRRARAVAVIVGANAVVLAALASIAELALRASGWTPPIGFSSVVYENDPIAGPWARPGQAAFHYVPCHASDGIHFNSLGMRDRERAREKTVPRVALVGDSLVQGLSVRDDETVSRQLESLAGGRFEVLNFGVSSVGTSVELLSWRKRLKLLAPDVVVLMFFTGNDVDDNHPVLKARADPGMAAISPYLLLDAQGKLTDTPRPGAAKNTSVVHRVLGFTALGRAVYGAYILARRATGRNAHAAAGAAPAADPAVLAEAWSITEQVIERFATEVAAEGSRFAVAVIPDGLQEIERGGGPTERTQDALRRIRAVAERAGFPVLDLTEAFVAQVKAEGPAPLSFACDPHWNAAGHRVAAEALHAFLTETVLAP